MAKALCLQSIHQDLVKEATLVMCNVVVAVRDTFMSKHNMLQFCLKMLSVTILLEADKCEVL